MICVYRDMPAGMHGEVMFVDDAGGVHETYFKDTLHDKEFFLSRTGRKLTAEAVAKILKKAATAAGVSKEIRVSPHTCRHNLRH